ncbi:MAG TPA: DMT family transporter [Solirubrobacter sp.]|nr:DMT family transporter [Solirubrobacter sp.]
MSRDGRPIGPLALALALALWSPSFAAIRVALDGYTPGAQALARFLLATLALGVVWARRGRRRPARADRFRLLAAGALGVTGYQLLLGYGEQRVDAGTAALLTALSPLLAVVLAAARLGERATPAGWTGVALGLAGGALIAVGNGTGGRPTGGALLVFAAAVCQAAWIVALKPLLARYRAVDVTCWTIWAGTALMVPFAPALIAQAPHAPVGADVATVWLGLGATLGGFVAFAAAAARLSASATAVSLYLLPLGGALVAWVWLAERPTAPTLVGGLVTVVGVVVATLPVRAPELEPT